MAKDAVSTMLNVEELGKKLTAAGRLKLRLLCVYCTDEVPEGAVPSYTIDRCIAKAVYTSSLLMRRLHSILRQLMNSAAAAEWYGLGWLIRTRS